MKQKCDNDRINESFFRKCSNSGYEHVHSKKFKKKNVAKKGISEVALKFDNMNTKGIYYQMKKQENHIQPSNQAMKKA